MMMTMNHCDDDDDDDDDDDINLHRNSCIFCSLGFFSV